MTGVSRRKLPERRVDFWLRLRFFGGDRFPLFGRFGVLLFAVSGFGRGGFGDNGFGFLRFGGVIFFVSLQREEILRIGRDRLFGGFRLARLGGILRRLRFLRRLCHFRLRLGRNRGRIGCRGFCGRFLIEEENVLLFGAERSAKGKERQGSEEPGKKAVRNRKLPLSHFSVPHFRKKRVTEVL